MIDVAPRHLKKVRAILSRHVPGCEVRAFGSRVKGTARKYSDLDMAIIGRKKLPRLVLICLKEAFEESDIPFRVEVIDWHATSAAFRRLVQKEFVVIQRPCNTKAQC